MKSKAEKVVVVSGYFDPLHVGHIEYFKMAKNLADELIVIVNNSKQCHLKKADEFMLEKDRLEACASVRYKELGSLVSAKTLKKLTLLKNETLLLLIAPADT